jgi:hypothetical protein
VASGTSLTIYPPYTGTTTPNQVYGIAGATDCAQEFSPMNGSGHPIYTGLNNYPNSSTSGGAPKGLTSAQMKAPWTSVGTQTMMCTDCHDTNSVTSAAQGPHGSAGQFLLRGPNANNWPNTTTFSSSWCANCHTDNVNLDNSHGSHHSAAGCYACHIIVPHGGKISRLIGDRDSMPARYAWQNDRTTMQVQSFRKGDPLSGNANSYTKSYCQAACTTEHGTAASENW